MEIEDGSKYLPMSFYAHSDVNVCSNDRQEFFPSVFPLLFFSGPQRAVLSKKGLKFLFHLLATVATKLNEKIRESALSEAVHALQIQHHYQGKAVDSFDAYDEEGWTITHLPSSNATGKAKEGLKLAESWSKSI